jgi:hypothetical protein
MPRPLPSVPTHRRRKPSNQPISAVPLPNGKRKVIYLGPWNSAESKAEYGRIVAIVAACGGTYPDSSLDLTVNEALVRYSNFIDGYYVDEVGKPAALP